MRGEYKTKFTTLPVVLVSFRYFRFFFLNIFFEKDFFSCSKLQTRPKLTQFLVSFKSGTVRF